MNAYVIAVLTVLAVAVAEPPRYNGEFSGKTFFYLLNGFRYRQKFQRQEAAPYPASGWRPAGAEFRLPSRVQNLPQIYGPPSTETETEAVTTDFPETTTTVEPEAQKLKEKLVNEKENEAEEVEVENSQQPQQQGIYYILLPSGQLSKVSKRHCSFLRFLSYQSIS